VVLVAEYDPESVHELVEALVQVWAQVWEQELVPVSTRV
jgi:hypothetical protein